MTGFKITGGKGFHILFENGWTASVQWGPGNYCDNKDNRKLLNGEERECGAMGCGNAEIAAWPKDGSMIELKDGNTVLGWQTPAQVLAFLNDIASRKE